MSEFPNTPEERTLLASEMALGLLDGDELALARRLQLSDTGFAALVEKAERDVAPLHEAYPEVAAPVSLKDRVNAAIDTEDAGSAASHPLPVNDNGPGPWRLIAMAASIVALALAGVLAFQTVNQPDSVQTVPAAQYVAQMATQEEGQFVVVRWSADRASLDVRAVGLADDSLAPALWIIPEDGTPRSFGTANGEGRGELEIPRDLAPFLTDGATLAVTMEDPASAPHEAPTPPIIATGTLLEI
ncbi:anti-sigma factor [uncultured Erythrobacter sp.]|uniref:anti-sigma factor n=1 Tax=uncultured Erythrobacter sp. TaxID=263913 RepID=UPI002621ACED|nr:anti-sigma factor [uncultured Erythrobacter sp.]